MGIKKIIEKAKRKKRVIKGKATKDKTYSSQHDFSDEGAASEAFKRSREKLFNINQWTKLPGISSSFQLYNRQGGEKQADKPQVREGNGLPGTPGGDYLIPN